jgi:hypothetical protein
LQDAEEVALGVGQDDPALVTGLADVGRPGSELDSAGDRTVLVVRPQIEMDTFDRIGVAGVGALPSRLDEDGRPAAHGIFQAGRV